MTKKFLISVGIIIVFLGIYEVSTFAQGKDCTNKGRRYPDSTILGDYQCQDGRWIKIK